MTILNRRIKKKSPFLHGAQLSAEEISLITSYPDEREGLSAASKHQDKLKGWIRSRIASQDDMSLQQAALLVPQEGADVFDNAFAFEVNTQLHHYGQHAYVTCLMAVPIRVNWTGTNNDMDSRLPDHSGVQRAFLSSLTSGGMRISNGQFVSALSPMMPMRMISVVTPAVVSRFNQALMKKALDADSNGTNEPLLVSTMNDAGSEGAVESFKTPRGWSCTSVFMIGGVWRATERAPFFFVRAGERPIHKGITLWRRRLEERIAFEISNMNCTPAEVKVLDPMTMAEVVRESTIAPTLMKADTFFYMVGASNFPEVEALAVSAFDGVHHQIELNVVARNINTREIAKEVFVVKGSRYEARGIAGDLQRIKSLCARHDVQLTFSYGGINPDAPHGLFDISPHYLH